MSEIAIYSSNLADVIGRRERETYVEKRKMTALNFVEITQSQYGTSPVMTCFPNGEEEARRGRQRLLSLMESCTAALYTPADLLGNAEENVTDDKLSEPEDGPVFKFDDVAEALPNLIKSSDPKPFKPPKLAEKAAKLIAAEDLDKDSVDCPEIDLDEDSDDWPEFEYPDDYKLCVQHKAGDFDFIPEDIQKEICDFARNKFWPAVLKYLGNIFPDFHNFSVADLENDGFYLPYNIEPISSELNYDLQRANEYQSWPDTDLLKIHGKRLVGSFIRVCKTIKKEELASEIYEKVEKCFIPNERQDPKDSFRACFGLKVEPSTGGIQCDCC